MWDLIVSVPDHCLSFYFALSALREDSSDQFLHLYKLETTLEFWNIGNVGIILPWQRSAFVIRKSHYVHYRIKDCTA